MKICILNASNPREISLESDEYVDLRDRKSCFEGSKVVKQCRSWHSWAYALESEFFVYQKQGWPGIFKYDGVILLVNREIGLVIPLIEQLKKAGKKVGISFHEGIQDLLSEPGKKWTALNVAVQKADFYINIFGQYQEFFKGWFGKDKVKFVNHCAPFDWDHGLTIPWEERAGDILCGTRTFNQRLSRNTFVTLATLSGWQKEFPQRKNRKIDFITEDGSADQIRDFIWSLGVDNVEVIQGPLDYNSWLLFLSNYKYVVHHDLTMNLGQVSLDCMMLDVIPIGGTTWFNIELGTDDGGNVSHLKDLVTLIELEYDQREYEELREGLLKRISPDEVREDLLRSFK